MKIILNYAKTFNKIIWSEKIPLIYTLLLPTVLYVFSNFQRLSIGGISVIKLLSSTSDYLAYMIVSVAINGIALQIISFRESGFLKTVTMISGGNRKFPVYGLLISEFIFGYLCVLMFGIFMAIFNFHKIIMIILLYTLIYICSAIPVMLFSILLTIFPMRVNTSSILANLILLGLIWLSAVRQDTGSFWGELFFGINPADYVTQVIVVILNLFKAQHVIHLYQVLSIFVLFIIYFFIGYAASSKVRINSLTSRN